METIMNQNAMKDRLLQTYPDATLAVTDLTGTENHWEVEIESQGFQGMSRIQMHQAVMKVFDPELKTGEVHALSIRAKAK
jgi:stress-induced morphogen